MVKNYLISLKNKGNFTTKDIENLSGIPEATIRKILTGETADPRFETVCKLVSAMGGSLDDLAEKKGKKEIETNSIVTLKEMYDDRVNDLKTQISLLGRNNKILAICTITLVLFFVAVFVFDISVGTHGWVRY